MIPNQTKTVHRKKCRAFTILEALIVTTVLGVVGAIASIAIASSTERTQELKLRNDVAALNRAVQVYIANGGDVTTAVDSQDVLARLKSRLSDEDAARFVGMTSSMVDLRITPVYQTPEEAESSQLRSAWDPNVRKFVLGNAGDAAIKRFVFEDQLAEGADQTETRSHSGFMYALEDRWIWEFEDRPTLTPTEATTVSIYFRDSENHQIDPVTVPGEFVEPDPVDPEPDPEPDPDAPTVLNPPLFTPEGGQYGFHAFPMEVSLFDPNEPSTSAIRYAVNEGSFRSYEGPFMVNDDDVIRAYAATMDYEKHLSSATVTETYEALPEVFDGDDKGKFKDGKNNNGHGNNLDGVDSSNPGQAPKYDPSGDIDDEKNTAVVSYAEENEVGIFTMGKAYGDSNPNTLKYKGTQFIQVEPEAMFQVGTLEYSNGTVESGTQADVVTMDLLVSLTTPDHAELLPVSMGFQNTPNTGSEWENADAVILRYRTIPLTQTLNGKSYYLVVQFGQATENGKADKGKLKVLENEKSSVPVYGYFTTKPPQ